MENSYEVIMVILEMIFVVNALNKTVSGSYGLKQCMIIIYYDIV